MVMVVPLEYFDKLLFYPPALKPYTLVLMGVSKKETTNHNKEYQIQLAKNILMRLKRKFSIKDDYIVDSTSVGNNSPALNANNNIIVIRNHNKLYTPATDASVEDRVRCILKNHQLLQRIAAKSPSKMSFI